MKLYSVLPIIVSICLLLVATSAQNESTAKGNGLRGSVKKVEVYWLVPDENGESGAVKRQRSETTLFERSGAVKEVIRHSGDTSGSKSVVIYNPDGRPVLQEYHGSFYRKDLNAPWESSEEYAYKYDGSGRVLEQAEIYKPIKRPVRRTTLRYDERGNVLEQSTFVLASDSPSARKVFTYDQLNRRTSETTFENGKFGSRTVRTYDPNGLLVAEIVEDESHRPLGRTNYRYDLKKRLLIKETVDLIRNKEQEREVHLYDDTKLTEEVSISYGSIPYQKTVRQLDQFGNVLAKLETLTDDAKKLMAEVAKQPSTGLIPFEAGAMVALLGMFDREAFKYEYDTHGNWIKRIEYAPTEFVIGRDNLGAEMKPVRTQIRAIEYYR